MEDGLIDTPLFPLGGFEPDRDDEMWDDEKIREFQNCLTYMLDLPYDPKTNKLWDKGGLSAEKLEKITNIKFAGSTYNMQKILESNAK